MRIETVEKGSFDVVGVGGFGRGDSNKLPFLLLLGRSESDGLRFEESKLIDEDRIWVFDDEEERSKPIAALRDNVVFVVVGFERREGHDEHFDTDQKVLP